jgi:penicillin-binding protein 1A
VLQYGTGRAAAIGRFAAGKTGTTSNYGDAWFVGWDSKYTVAVWVGYPDSLVPMTTAFNGGPVLGGTYPALIWHDFMTSALTIDKGRAEKAAAGKTKSGEGGEGSATSTPEVSAAPPSAGSSPPSTGGSSRETGKSSAPGTGGEAGSGNSGAGKAAPEQAPAPSSPAPSSPSPTPSAPPSSSPPPSSPTGGVSPGG